MPLTGTSTSSTGELIVTEQEAHDYFTTRRNSSKWFETGVDTTAELTTAQNQLDLLYVLDADDQFHKNAIFEQALFNLKYGAGLEDRLSMISVGVTDAGLIKEKYKDQVLNMAIAPYAAQALATVRKRSDKFFLGLLNIKRDEET